MKENPLDILGNVIALEVWNPRAEFKQLMKGNRFRLSFECDRDAFELFEEPRPGERLLVLVARIPDDEAELEGTVAGRLQELFGGPISPQNQQSSPPPSASREEKKEKGPYGKYAQALWGKGLQNNRIVRRAIGASYDETEDQAWDKLAAYLGVSSMTWVSPVMIEEMCHRLGLSTSFLPQRAG